LVRENPSVAQYVEQLGRTAAQWGEHLQEYGEPAAAVPALEAAAAAAAKLAAAHPARAEYARRHRTAAGQLGHQLYAARRYADAARAYEQAAAAKPPGNPAPDEVVMLSRIDLEIGRAHWKAGAAADAGRAFARGRDRLEPIVNARPADAAAARALGGLYLNSGLLAYDEADPATALDWYARAVALVTPVYEKDPADAEARFDLRGTHWGRADALDRLGRPAEAVAAYDQALAFDDGTKRAVLRAERAIAVARLGRAAEAVAVVDDLAPAAAKDGQTLYRLARALAVVAAQPGAAGADGTAARAVALLDQTRAAGHFADPVAFKKLAAEPDFAPLRGRDDYRRVEAAARPAGP
jgi:tetratricopeptide (TPR) repeat protein